MPLCDDSHCECHRVMGIYKTPDGADYARARKMITLDRLAKVDGLSIEHADHSVWLSMGGFRAPCLVMEGAVHIRTQFPSLRPSDVDAPAPMRQVISVPGDFARDPARVTQLAAAVEQAHQAFPAYDQDCKMISLFKSVLGRFARVQGVEEDGSAVVTARVRITLDQAEHLRDVLETLHESTTA
jgi:hypothetical protein